mgnify:CR=1 FL=1
MKLSYFLFLFISPILLVSCGNGKYKSMVEAQRAAQNFIDNGRLVNTYNIESVNRKAKFECEVSKDLKNKAELVLNNNNNPNFTAIAKLRLKKAKERMAFDCNKKNWGLKFVKNNKNFNEKFTRKCELEILTAQYVCEEKKVSADFITEKKWSNSKTQFKHFKYRKTQ